MSLVLETFLRGDFSMRLDPQDLRASCTNDLIAKKTIEKNGANECEHYTREVDNNYNKKNTR